MGLILSLLLLFSGLIRGYAVSSLPPELFGDEVDVGYQAYSLLHTGRDLYGQLFPTYIHSLSEWRTPLLMYYTVPAIFIFNNTEWGVRGPEVVLGTLSPVILFLLVYQLSHKRSLSLISSLALSLMPWHILYSRAAFEAVLLLDFELLGTLLFIRRQYFMAGLFFILTPYIYSTATVFTPLWLVCLGVFYKPKIKLVSLLPVVLILPFVISLFSGHAAERFGKVGLFNNREITDEIFNFRRENPGFWERWFSNKPVVIAQKIYTNYLSAFSPEFLFIRGDPTARQSLQYIGELLPVWAPFLILGLVFMIKRRQYLWLSWLLLAPVPAALTYDGAYHATRLFMMIPPLSVAVGTGIITSVNFFRRPVKIFVYLIIWLVISYQFVQAANYYLNHYSQRTWIWWHVGFKTAMTQVARLAPLYPRVFINNTYEPSLIRFLFYSRYPPAEFQRNFTLDQPKSGIAPDYYGFFLAPKYYFGNFSLPPGKSIPDVLIPGDLYVVSQRDNVAGDWDWRKNPPGGVKVLFTSTNPLNQPIFYLVTKS